MIVDKLFYGNQQASEKSLCFLEWNQIHYDKDPKFVIYNTFGRKFHQKNMTRWRRSRLEELSHVQTIKIHRRELARNSLGVPTVSKGLLQSLREVFLYFTCIARNQCNCQENRIKAMQTSVCPCLHSDSTHVSHQDSHFTSKGQLFTATVTCHPEPTVSDECGMRPTPAARRQ